MPRTRMIFKLLFFSRNPLLKLRSSNSPQSHQCILQHPASINHAVPVDELAEGIFAKSVSFCESTDRLSENRANSGLRVH